MSRPSRLMPVYIACALHLVSAGAWAGWSTPSGIQAAAQPAPAQATPRDETATNPGQKPVQGPPSPQGIQPPPDYVIGPDDVLAVLFWREKDLSVDNIVVRPDGMITLPLINDIKAAGFTPNELRDAVTKAIGEFVETPSATVVVKQINSRKVFITGQVGKPGTYPLTGPTTVLQLIAIAGGVLDFAKENDIVIMRTEGGRTTNFRFQYKDVIKGRNLQQNILLKPGDTVVVP